MKIYLLLIGALCFFSCNSQGDKAQDPLSTQRDTNKLVRDIPVRKDGKYSNVYMYVSLMADKLKIDQLNNGFDSLQFRIWLTYNRSDSSQMVQIKKQGDKWIGNLYSWYFLRKEKTGIVDTIIKVDKVSPQSGWSMLLDKLYNFKIDQLPEMENIQGNSFSIIHADAVSVEMASKNFYRLYSYTAPADFKKEFWQAKNMEEILLLLEREFDFKRIRS